MNKIRARAGLGLKMLQAAGGMPVVLEAVCYVRAKKAAKALSANSPASSSGTIQELISLPVVRVPSPGIRPLSCSVRI